MKKINFKILIITSLVCLLPIILGVIFYNQLPEQIAIHFDINNNPDNYFGKSIFVFCIPLLMMLFQIFTCIVNDLSDKNKEANKKTTMAFKWIIPVITVVMYIVTLSYAIGINLDIRRIVMNVLGIIFIIIGNYIPKTKGNIYIRFRKIKNEKVLSKIARTIGYIGIINGILFIISSLFSPIYSVILIILLIIEILVLYIYSYIKDKKETRKY